MQEAKDKYKLWAAALEAEGVPEHLRAALIAKFRVEIARAIRTTRPTWNERAKYPELANLRAPEFLKSSMLTTYKMVSSIKNLSGQSTKN
jgi:hypothetical protein